MITGKRIQALTGGRPTNAQDILDLSDEVYRTFEDILTEFGDCILTGCVISGTGGNYNVTVGSVFIDGEICYFEGATGISLPQSLLKVQSNTDSKTYADGSNKATRKKFTAEFDAAGTFQINASNNQTLAKAIRDQLPDADAGEKGVLELATIAETETGSNDTKAVTPLGLNYMVGDALKRKVLQIGAWDMNVSASGTATITVAHGLADVSLVAGIRAVIIDDLLAAAYDLQGGNVLTSTANQGSIGLNATNAVLSTYVGSLFDSGSFDGGANRGFIVIEYISV